MHERLDDGPQPRQRLGEPKDPQKSQQPQHDDGEGFEDHAGRREFDEHRGDDEKVEAVPPVVEKGFGVVALRQNLEHDVQFTNHPPREV